MLKCRNPASRRRGETLDEGVESGQHDDALLLVGVGPRHDGGCGPGGSITGARLALPLIVVTKAVTGVT